MSEEDKLDYPYMCIASIIKGESCSSLMFQALKQGIGSELNKRFCFFDKLPESRFSEVDGTWYNGTQQGFTFVYRCLTKDNLADTLRQIKSLCSTYKCGVGFIPIHTNYVF